MVLIQELRFWMRSSFRLYQNLQKEHMGIRSRRMSVRQSKYRSPRFIRCCGGFRRMTAWKHMTGRSTAETDGITK